MTDADFLRYGDTIHEHGYERVLRIADQLEAKEKVLREIESLREQVEHEERRAKAAEFAGVEAMKRGDEWKRRAKEAIDAHRIPANPNWENYNKWFEEE